MINFGASPNVMTSSVQRYTHYMRNDTPYVINKTETSKCVRGVRARALTRRSQCRPWLYAVGLFSHRLLPSSPICHIIFRVRCFSYFYVTSSFILYGLFYYLCKRALHAYEKWAENFDRISFRRITCTRTHTPSRSTTHTQAVIGPSHSWRAARIGHVERA